MIPDIILNKIYWYLWRYRQRKICREYHYLFVYMDNKLYYHNTSYFTRIVIIDRNEINFLIRNFKTGKYSNDSVPKNYFTQPIMFNNCN
jgi:hypothetical protein